MHLKGVMIVAATLAAQQVAGANTLYRSDFETAHPADWIYSSNVAGDTASALDGGGAANYAFDYSSVGIPAAPNQSSTRGLQLQVALPGTTVLQGDNVSPVGLVLPSQYRVSFYAWQNANGPYPTGGDGATLVTKVAIGASGTNDEWNGGTLTAVNVGVTNDGGSTYADWRAYTSTYPNGKGVPLLPKNGVFPAGTGMPAVDNLHAYYSSFTGGTAPAAQTALYPQQTGSTPAGTLAFGWHEWVVTKSATSVTWTVDGKLITTIGSAFLPASFGPNIGLGMVDSVVPASTDPNAAALQFSIIDGLSVDSLTNLLVGDANYDNVVDFADLLALAKHYGATDGQGWNSGDFNADGAVNFNDLLLLAAHYGPSAGTSARAAAELPSAFTSDWLLAQSLVPEPAVLLLGLAVPALTARRRTSHRASA